MRRMKRPAGFAIVLGVFAAVALGGLAHASMVDLTLEESACIADPEDAGNWRVLLRFEIPDALEGATVDFAALRAVIPIDCDEEREISVEVFPVTCPWSAGEVAWGEDWQSGEGAWDERRGSMSSVVTDEHPVLAVDVTPAVDYWLRADAATQGLVLVPFIPELVGALVAPPPEIALRVWYTGVRRHQPGADGH
jgi:hypothetical protein